jgi:uncharacterized cupredoxin-like copper-binding protein
MELLSATSHLTLRISWLAAAALLIAGAAALADDTVNVTLYDEGMESMRMEFSAPQVKAGNVTFNVTNKSETLIHEFVVVNSGQPIELWPYNDSEKEVQEDALKVVNEIEDLEPGKSGTLTVMLEPGTYTLFCNLAGHFKAGMVHTLTVTE